MTQEEYDTVVAERDSLLTEVLKLRKLHKPATMAGMLAAACLGTDEDEDAVGHSAPLQRRAPIRNSTRKRICRVLSDYTDPIVISTVAMRMGYQKPMMVVLVRDLLDKKLARITLNKAKFRDEINADCLVELTDAGRSFI